MLRGEDWGSEWLPKFSQLTCSRTWVRIHNSTCKVCASFTAPLEHSRSHSSFPALLVRILAYWAFLKRGSPEFLMSHHSDSPSSRLGSFNCWQGVSIMNQTDWVWHMGIPTWKTDCLCSKSLYNKNEILGRSKAICVWIMVGFVGQSESANRTTSASLKKCTKMSSLDKNQTYTKWNILATDPYTMVTLSASSGHTLVIHFQRKDLSKCRFCGSDFKHRYFSDVSDWVSSLDVFWQERGGVTGGTWEISLSLFWNLGCFCVCVFFNTCIDTILWTINLI